MKGQLKQVQDNQAIVEDQLWSMEAVKIKQKTYADLMNLITTVLLELTLVDEKLELIKELQHDTQSNLNRNSYILNDWIDTSFKPIMSIEEFTKYYSFPSFKYGRFQKINMDILPFMYNDVPVKIEDNIEFIHNKTHISKTYQPLQFHPFNLNDCAHAIVFNTFQYADIKNCHVSSIADPKSAFIIHPFYVSLFSTKQSIGKLICSSYNSNVQVKIGIQILEYNDTCHFSADGFAFSTWKPDFRLYATLGMQTKDLNSNFDIDSLNFALNLGNHSIVKVDVDVKDDDVDVHVYTQYFTDSSLVVCMLGLLVLVLGIIFKLKLWQYVEPHPEYRMVKSKYGFLVLICKYNNVDYTYCVITNNFISAKFFKLEIFFDATTVEAYISRLRAKLPELGPLNENNKVTLKDREDIIFCFERNLWVFGNEVVYGIFHPNKLGFKEIATQETPLLDES